MIRKQFEQKRGKMMRALTFSTILLLMTMISACSGGSDENQADTGEQAMSNQQKTQTEEQESNVPYNFRIEMQQMYDHYFELKEAVTESDLQAARTAAGELSAFTSSVLDDMLESENQGLWLGISRIIRTETDKLIESDSPREMRIYFEHISRTMVRVADSFDPTGGPYYLMECEDATVGDNQWLSRDETIRNPYQTSADVTCGEIVDEF